MKKYISIIMVAILTVLLVSGCSIFGNNNGSTENDSSAKDVLENSKVDIDNNNENDNTIQASKTIVVYFSKTGGNYNVGNVEVGNTALMASYIVEYLDADSFEIIPVKKYSDDYSTSTEEAKKEQNENARPEIKNTLNNFSDYDTVFIGYPIWWGDMPQILYTFLESYDFSGKTVIPFNTHEGSGNAGTYSTIKNKLSTANVNTNGLAIRGTVARTNEGKEQTINWLQELGY